MELKELYFEISPQDSYQSIPCEFSHIGIVSSGDMEVSFEKKKFDGKVKIKVRTPVLGFDHIWDLILKKFIKENKLGDLEIEINDNNSTPFIVSLRMKQALIEAMGGSDGKR